MGTVHKNLAAVLAARQDELEARIATIEAEALSAVGGIGFGKRIGEGTNIAVERFTEVARHDRLQIELATVRRAREKLDQDDTDLCDQCGRVVPAERREAIPWAVSCVDCSR